LKRTLIPGTSLEASRLGFGTASLHHVVRARKRRGLIHAALDAGFTHFDTARMYGEGLAERELGRCLQGGLRSQVTITTKFGLPAARALELFPTLMYSQRALNIATRRLGWIPTSERRRALSKDAVEASFLESLRALRCDYVDMLFVHEPHVSEAADLEILAEFLLQQKSSGRVRYLGLAGKATSCVGVMQWLPGLFDVMQVEDSLEQFEANAVLEAGWPLQITFGYLRLAQRAMQKGHIVRSTATDVFTGALARNAEGVVLVSTRRPDHMRSLAELTEVTEQLLD